jgi:MFS family permease
VPPVLRSPKLRRIILAYAVNRLGTWFGLVALLIATYDHTHSALAVSALMFAALALPAFAVPVLVARVERSRQRSALARLYVFEALVTLTLAFMLSHFSLPVVLVLVAVDGTAALAATALLRAEVARAGREEHETQLLAGQGQPGTADEGSAASAADDGPQRAEREANAALNVAFSLTFVIGPALGGIVVAAAGTRAALLIDAGSFLACASLLVDLSPHVEEAGAETVRGRLAAAWHHINEVPWLRALLLAQLVAMTFIETGAPIEVPFVKSTLGAGDGGLGLLLATWGAGAVLGSLAFARLVARPLGYLLVAGTVMIGAAYLGLAVSHTLALACVAGVVGGVGNGMQWPSLISAVQQLTPARLHGRLMGAVEALSAVCLAAGLALGGVLVTLTSTRTAFTIVGAFAVASSVLLGRVAALALASGHPVEADDLGLAPEPAAPRALDEARSQV